MNRLPVKRYFYQFCDLGIKSGLDLGVRLSEGFPVLNAGESVMLQPDMDGGRLYFVGIKNWS